MVNIPVSRVPIGHRGATMRKALFEDSDESDSAEQLPVVHESVSQQRRLKGLRKVQLWAWRQQVKDNMDDDESPFIHDSTQLLFTPWCMYAYSQPPYG